MLQVRHESLLPRGGTVGIFFNRQARIQQRRWNRVLATPCLRTRLSKSGPLRKLLVCFQHQLRWRKHRDGEKAVLLESVTCEVCGTSGSSSASMSSDPNCFQALCVVLDKTILLLLDRQPLRVRPGVWRWHNKEGDATKPRIHRLVTFIGEEEIQNALKFQPKNNEMVWTW